MCVMLRPVDRGATLGQDQSGEGAVHGLKQETVALHSGRHVVLKVTSCHSRHLVQHKRGHVHLGGREGMGTRERSNDKLQNSIYQTVVCVCLCVCVCVSLSASMRECICAHLGSSLCQCYGDAPQTLPYLVHEGLRPQEVTEAHTQEAAHTHACSALNT